MRHKISAVFALIGIAISLGRCGPVASSLNKNTTGSGGSGTNGLGVGQIFSTVLLGQDELSLLPGGAVYNLTTGANSEIETYRAQGAVNVPAGNQTAVTVYLVLNIPHTQITPTMDTFKASYMPVSQGVWRLGIDPAVPVSLWNQIQPDIVQARLVFAQ